MRRRPIRRPGPPARPAHGPVPRRQSRHTTVSARSSHSTVSAHRPLGGRKPPAPQPRVQTPRPPKGSPKRQVGRILDDDSSLLDLIDNLLSKGVMLNADLILALADVDLIYVRLSALLCAADRVLPSFAKASASAKASADKSAGKPEFASGKPRLRPATGEAQSRRSAQREGG